MFEYDFKISYRKGIENTVADALSCNVVSTPTDTFIAMILDDTGDIVTVQNNNAFIQDVKAYVKKGMSPCHTVAYSNKVKKTEKDANIDKDSV